MTFTIKNINNDDRLLFINEQHDAISFYLEDCLIDGKHFYIPLNKVKLDDVKLPEIQVDDIESLYPVNSPWRRLVTKFFNHMYDLHVNGTPVTLEILRVKNYNNSFLRAVLNSNAINTIIENDEKRKQQNSGMYE